LRRLQAAADPNALVAGFAHLWSDVLKTRLSGNIERVAMALKPNYRQERAQKNRARETRKQEKLKRREEASARRKALREGTPVDDDAASKPEIDETH
jgi:hypothetical protein